MSKTHPIIAVTGACGAGTSSVQKTFKEIFFRHNIQAGFIEGDGFLRYDDKATEKMIIQAKSEGKSLSCYGPDLNDFSKLESCFKSYAESGSGCFRYKVNQQNQHLFDEVPGEFTEWQNLPQDTDCLFYEGMHGGVVAESWTRRKSGNGQIVDNERRNGHSGQGVDVAQYVDLLIGVVPAINLEWIQRIQGDRIKWQLTAEKVTEQILHQLQDYIHFIVPQFSLTDINFQRMPVVDTSNPFDMSAVPNDDESVLVVSFREAHKHDVAYYADSIEGAVMTRRNSLVIPGCGMGHALDVICSPLIEQLIDQSHY